MRARTYFQKPSVIWKLPLINSGYASFLVLRLEEKGAKLLVALFNLVSLRIMSCLSSSWCSYRVCSRLYAYRSLLCKSSCRWEGVKVLLINLLLLFQLFFELFDCFFFVFEFNYKFGLFNLELRYFLLVTLDICLCLSIVLLDFLRQVTHLGEFTFHIFNLLFCNLQFILLFCLRIDFLLKTLDV